MVRRRGKKRRREIYRSDIHSYSIYPRITTSGDEGITKGRVYTVVISDVNERGQGVARLKGFKVFVYNATVGDRVKVKIVKVAQGYAIGKVVQWLGRLDEY